MIQARLVPSNTDRKSDDMCARPPILMNRPLMYYPEYKLHLIVPSPVLAVTQLQELEADLDDDELLRVIKVFQKDTQAVDTYMVLTQESI